MENTESDYNILRERFFDFAVQTLGWDVDSDVAALYESKKEIIIVLCKIKMARNIATF